MIPADGGLEFVQWLGWILAVIGAAVTVLSHARTQNMKELKALTDTRAQRITDLENVVTDLREQHMVDREALVERVTRLEAQLEAVHSMKAVEIGDHVVHRLIEMRAV